MTITSQNILADVYWELIYWNPLGGFVHSLFYLRQRHLVLVILDTFFFMTP